MSIEKHRNKQTVLNGQQHDELKSHRAGHLVETQKRASNRQRTASYQSSLCQVKRSESLMNHAPSSKPAADEMLGSVFSEAGGVIVKEVEMRTRAFVDHLLGDREFNGRRGMDLEALQIIGENKDLVMEFWRGPNPKIARLLKPVLGAKFFECDAVGFENNDNKPEKTDIKRRGSSETIIVSNAHKIEIPKSASQIVKYSDSVTCHCSFVHSQQKRCDLGVEAKPASFSVKEMKKKLRRAFGGTSQKPNRFPMDRSHKLDHSRSRLKVGGCIFGGVDTKSSLSSSINHERKQKLHQKPLLKSICIPDTTRRKVDLSSLSLSKKHGPGVTFEGRRCLSARVNKIHEIEPSTGKRLSNTLGWLLSSPEHDFCIASPRPRGSGKRIPRSTQMRFTTCCNSPVSSLSGQKISVNPCDDYNADDGKVEILQVQTSPPLIQSTGYQGLDTTVHVTECMKSDGSFLFPHAFQSYELLSYPQDMFSPGEARIEEMNCTEQHKLCKPEVSNEINNTHVTETLEKNDELQQNKENAFHYADSLPGNEEIALPFAMDDIPSTPLMRIYSLVEGASTEYQEEHPSPVSVLEPSFTDDSSSRGCIMLQTAEHQWLQPLHIEFEDWSFESISQELHCIVNPCASEIKPISRYVHSLFQASSLNWNHLSYINPSPQELLHPSIFNKVNFSPTYSHFDPKVLFDRINEVLLQIYEYHACISPWLASIKQKIASLHLEDAVLHEIMREAEFFLQPLTKNRSLDEIVSKDLSNSRMWFDARFDTEQILVQVTEDVLEESMLDVILEFHT